MTEFIVYNFNVSSAPDMAALAVKLANNVFKNLKSLEHIPSVIGLKAFPGTGKSVFAKAAFGVLTQDSVQDPDKEECCIRDKNRVAWANSVSADEGSQVRWYDGKVINANTGESWCDEVKRDLPPQVSDECIDLVENPVDLDFDELACTVEIKRGDKPDERIVELRAPSDLELKL